MVKIVLGKSVEDLNKGNVALRRYMSLEKLINLLETKELFFTPLSSYAESDPFEGYPPKCAI